MRSVCEGEPLRPIASAEISETPETPPVAPAGAQESVPARTSARQVSTQLVRVGAVHGALSTRSPQAVASCSSETNTIARAGCTIRFYDLAYDPARPRHCSLAMVRREREWERMDDRGALQRCNILVWRAPSPQVHPNRWNRGGCRLCPRETQCTRSATPQATA